MWNEKEANQWILGQLSDLSVWPHPWHGIDFQGQTWNNLISEIREPIDMEWKGCVPTIHDYDIDLCVTMVGWVDVLISDWGGFRLQKTVEG